MSEAAGPVILKSEGELDVLLDTNKNFLTVVSFIAPWSENCTPTKELTRELIVDPELQKVVFVELDAENFPNISKKYGISSVPTIVFLRGAKELDRLVGADVRNYASRVVSHANAGPSVEGIPVKTVPKAGAQGGGEQGSGNANESLVDRLKRLINQSSIMIFMKGNPAQPRCGFSRTLIEILNETGLKYETFDILTDEDVRQGLKEFSQWKTYPQVYVNGSLVGGLDIIRDFQETGSLMDVLTGKEQC